MKSALLNQLASKIDNRIIDKESKAYNACEFSYNNKRFHYRKAKITPKKAGLFVTFWKRSLQGPIAPFHKTDSFDFFLVELTNGYFLFPKEILVIKGIISTNQNEGKRAFRVYPPSKSALNKTAISTQKWQLNYYYKNTESILTVLK